MRFVDSQKCTIKCAIQTKKIITKKNIIQTRVDAECRNGQSTKSTFSKKTAGFKSKFQPNLKALLSKLQPICRIWEKSVRI
jgi:hypothetical protein